MAVRFRLLIEVVALSSWETTPIAPPLLLSTEKPTDHPKNAPPSRASRMAFFVGPSHSLVNLDVTLATPIG